MKGTFTQKQVVIAFFAAFFWFFSMMYNFKYLFMSVRRSADFWGLLLSFLFLGFYLFFLVSFRKSRMVRWGALAFSAMPLTVLAAVWLQQATSLQSWMTPFLLFSVSPFYGFSLIFPMSGDLLYLSPYFIFFAVAVLLLLAYKVSVVFLLRKRKLRSVVEDLQVQN